MADHHLDPRFQRRAMEANRRFSELIAELGFANNDEDGTDPDSLRDVRLVFNPILAGAMAALADIAWDSGPASQTVEVVVKAFAESARPHLESAAKDRPSGLLWCMAEDADGTVN